MATTDNNSRIQAAVDEQAQALNTIKSDLVSKLDTIQGFSENYTNYGGVPDAYASAVDITIRSVDSLSSELGKIHFNTPTKPAGLTAMQPERFKTHVYDVKALDGLEAKLMDIVTISDTGILKELSAVNITDDFQESLYNYQYTNDQRDLEYQLDILDAKWAADGYTLPPDALVHNRAWLVARFDEKRTDRTRNIFSEIAKLAQQNVQWAYENGIKVEQMHADFAIRYAEIYRSIIEALVAIYRADVEVAISQLDASIKTLQAEIEVAKLQLGRDEAEATLKVTQADSRLNAFMSSYSSSLQANTQTFSHRLDAAKNVAQGYQGIFNAWGSRYTAIDLKATK